MIIDVSHIVAELDAMAIIFEAYNIYAAAHMCNVKIKSYVKDDPWPDGYLIYKSKIKNCHLTLRMEANSNGIKSRAKELVKQARKNSDCRTKSAKYLSSEKYLSHTKYLYNDPWS